MFSADTESNWQPLSTCAQVDGVALVAAGCGTDDVNRGLDCPLLGAVGVQSCLSCECDVPSAADCDEALDVSASLRSVHGFWEKGLRMTPGVIRYLLMKYMYRIGS